MTTSTTDTYRECRIAGCTTRHKRSLFCCRDHWFSLPQELRSQIWRTYRNGSGIFTVEYLQASENAEAYLENRDPRDMSEALSD